MRLGGFRKGNYGTLGKSIFPQLLNLRYHRVSGLFKAYLSDNDLTAPGFGWYLDEQESQNEQESLAVASRNLFSLWRELGIAGDSRNDSSGLEFFSFNCYRITDDNMFE